MTSDIDTLLSLAREVGAEVTKWIASEGHFIEFEREEAFIALAERIRQDERERLIQICERFMADDMPGGVLGRTMRIIDAIRSSGTSQSQPEKSDADQA